MKKLLLILTFFLTTHADELYDLSVVAIFRDEASYLKEWVEYHRQVGVDHFYLFNHLSEDNYLEVLQPYIDAGTVELFDWPHTFHSLRGWSRVQNNAYRKILLEKGEETKWLAIIDTDEFLLPVEKTSLKDLLVDFETYGGLVVNWQCYGTSNVPVIPEGELLIELLVRKASKEYVRNRYVKSIVQPKYVASINNPHYCIYKPGFYSVTENQTACKGKQTPSVSVDKIRINHYWTRDEDFLYNVKIARAKKFWHQQEQNILDTADRMNEEAGDHIIDRFIEPLRERLFCEVP